MIEIAWSDLLNSEFGLRPAAMTIGVFDGLHRGHRSLLSSITNDPELLPVVVTFQRHPAEILASEGFPGFIMSLAQKRRVLMTTGIGVVVLIDFSLEFSRVSGSDFLQTLIDSYDLRFAGIGHDFRCGYQMSMDKEDMRSYLESKGVRVDLVEAVRDRAAIVSSTQIRRHIRAGRLDAAKDLLGRSFALDVSGETIERDGPEIWIPLDDRGLLPESRQILPPPGQYSVIVQTEHGDEREVLTIGENSIRLPLAPDTRIRYIVLQENRVK